MLITLHKKCDERKKVKINIPFKLNYKNIIHIYMYVRNMCSFKF